MTESLTITNSIALGIEIFLFFKPLYVLCKIPFSSIVPILNAPKTEIIFSFF